MGAKNEVSAPHPAAALSWRAAAIRRGGGGARMGVWPGHLSDYVTFGASLACAGALRVWGIYRLS